MNQIKIIKTEYHPNTNINDMINQFETSVNNFLRRHEDAEILCIDTIREFKGTLIGMYATIKYKEEDN